MITLQNVLERFNAVKNNKSAVVIVAFLALIAFTFYQFPATKDRAVGALSSSVLSIFQGSAVTENPAADSELSTGETEAGMPANEKMASEVSWSIRKSEKGETVWQVYAEMVRGNSDIALKNQTINGLKNLTVLQNNIPFESAVSNSLKEGVDYSFLSQEAVTDYAKKLSEANNQMQGGKMLQDLSQDLQTAYLLANAPSYQFLSTLQASSPVLFN